MRSLISTIAIAAIVAFLTGAVHGGFMLVLVIPFLIVWLLRSAWTMYRHRERRRLLAGKIAIWIATILVVALLHRYYATEARAEADAAIRAVVAYKNQHGEYPKHLSEAGVNNGRWHVGYGVDEHGPWLLYPATFVVFEVWRYNFLSERWEYLRD